MADLTLPPSIIVSELTISPWAPGQSDVIAPYGPALLPSGPATPGWTGTVRLAPRSVGPEQDAEDRSMLALQGRLRGNRHRVRLPLGPQYRGAPPPDDMTATVTAARRVGEVERITVAYVNQSDWTPTPGSYCNVGERLYLIDAVGADTLDLTPATTPRAIWRPRGIFPTPGGGGPAVRPDTGAADEFVGRGLATFRGSVYEAAEHDQSNVGALYWVDLATGTRRLVWYGQNRVPRSLAAAYGRLYVNLSISPTTSRLSRVDLDLSDPERNSIVDVWQFTDLGTGGADRLRGMAEWQGPDDSGPKLYVSKDNQLFKSNGPPPDIHTTTTFASAFTLVTGPTGFSRINALSPGPNPGDPLYVLDTGDSKLWTWDGVEQVEFAAGSVGAELGPNVVQLSNCFAMEWIDGSLYVEHRTVGTTGAGIARVNIDTPADAQNVEFAAPFVWARLSGGAASGPVGSQFPATSWQWTEVAR